MRSPLSLLLPILNIPSSCSLSPQKRCSRPLLIVVVSAGPSPIAPCLCCTEEPRPGHSTPGVSSQAEQRERIPSLTCCPMIPLTLLAARAHCGSSWLICHSPRLPSPSLQSHSPAGEPQLVPVLRAIPPQVQDPTLALVGPHLFSLCSSLSRSHRIAVQPSGGWATPPRSELSVNLLRVHSIPLSRFCVILSMEASYLKYQ